MTDPATGLSAAAVILEALPRDLRSMLLGQALHVDRPRLARSIEEALVEAGFEIVPKAGGAVFSEGGTE